MITTSLYRLQEKNPSTFTVMMNRRQREKLVRYLDEIENYGLLSQGDQKFGKLISKLQNGHMSYNNNELSIMRAAITLNRFVMPISFICKKYIAFTMSRSEA